ncbi:autotransporter outer membrane beta-barrel domain-containing protein [Phascolarctobacterium sp.]
MRRKHLEKAVILSLLLANVCRVGGATEYNTTITGQENGYDSIKVADPVSGEITYTFAGENTIKDDRTGVNTFHPVSVEYEKVTIDVGDKLDLIGKDNFGSTIQSVDILARSEDAGLKFTGGELNLTDESNGFVVVARASEGGSIVFDNKITNIGAAKDNYSSWGLEVVGTGSKISFTDNAETLNLHTAHGIRLMDNGSLEFTNANGIVNIVRSAGDITENIGISIGDSDQGGGGSITFAGKETNIKLLSEDGNYGGTAVSMKAYADNDNNLLNFNADKTTLQASEFGIYIGKYSQTVSNYTGDTTLNFTGVTDISAINKTTGSSLGAMAISSYELAAKLNFDEHVSLTAVTDKTGRDCSAFGAQIERGSVLTALKGMDVLAKANASKAVGLGTYDKNSLISVTGATVINAESTSGDAVGIQGWKDSIVDLGGTLVANAKSESGTATGLWSWDSGSINVSGDAVINVEGAGTNAKGMYITDGGTGTFGSDVNINMGVAATDPKLGYYVRAITADGEKSAVNIGGNAVFNLAGVDTIGLDVAQKAEVTIDKDYVVAASGSGDYYSGDYQNAAKGMAVKDNAKVTVKGNAVLDISGKMVVVGTDVNSAAVTVDKIYQLKSETDGGWKAEGVVTYSSTVKLGSAVIAVTSKNEKYTSQNSLGIYSNINTNVTVDGDTVVEVTADKNNALGLAGYWNSTTAIGKSAQINVSSKQGAATGIKGDTNMTTTIGGDAVITATGAGDTTGVFTDKTSNFAVEGNTIIKAASTGGGDASGISGNSKLKAAWITVSGTGGINTNNVNTQKYSLGIKNWYGAETEISGDAVIDVSADFDAAKGIYLWKQASDAQGTVQIGGNAAVTVRNAAASSMAHGFDVDAGNQLTVGKAAQIEVAAASNNSKGIYSHEAGSNVAIGGDALITVTGAKDAGGKVTAEANYARGITSESGSKVTIGGNAMTNVSGKNAIGIEAFKNAARADSVGAAEITIAGNYGAAVQASESDANGIVTDNGGKVTIGGSASIIAVSDKAAAVGIDNHHFTIDGKSAGRVEIKGAANITAVSNVDGNVWGIYNYNGAATEIGSAAAGALTAVTVRGNGGSEIKGIEAMINSSIDLHGAALVDVRGDSSTEVIGVIAGRSGDTAVSHSTINFGDTAYIKVGHNTADSKARAAGATFGVVACNNSEVNFAGDTVIDTSGTAAGSNTMGAYANGGGSIEFAKGLVLDNKGRKHSLYVAGTGSSLKVNSSGSGDVYLTGDITAINEGTLELDLSTDKSYYEGAATTANAGKLHMKLRQGSLWNVTADSNLTSLEFGDGARIDMAQQTGYQELQAAGFTGSGGTFVLGTDIADDQSDKVFIAGSTQTGTAQHNIQIRDAGRGTGADLHLLLVDDASGKYAFTAQDTYGGGIYNYKAKLSSEADGSGMKWYLESIRTAGVTEDVRALSRVSDGIYALAVTGNDSLRGRLGELRDDNAEQGAWARVYGGRLKGDNFSENYQTYQIGYDLPFAGSPDSETAQNWRGGAAFEYTKGSIGYGVGSGENKMTALALYGTKHTRFGDNVDIILKHGRIKGDIKTYGIGADSGDYDTNATALSVEYNKRLAQTKNIFIEPQVQLTLTHIAGSDFTTGRGIMVHSGGINSAVGRLGMAVGKQYQQGNVYFKTSLLHEFGGSSDLLMTSAGESYGESKQYGGTWYELALGGNVNLSKDNELYFDVSRSFGGDFQKQWQVNAGLRWSF